MDKGKEAEAIKSGSESPQHFLQALPNISIELEPDAGESLPAFDKGESLRKSTNEISTGPLQPFSSTFPSRSLSIPSSTMRQRRPSLFKDVIQTSLSEGTRLNEEKANELEGRLKFLVSAFSRRTSNTKVEITRPPTPSSEESDSDISTAVSENNLLHRLETFLPTPHASRRQSYQSVDDDWLQWKCCQGVLDKLRPLLTLQYLLDPQSSGYILWIGIVSAAFLYNAWVIPLREIFEYQDELNVVIWFWTDCCMDSIYLVDLLFVKSHVRFVQEGFPVQSAAESWIIYVHTSDFIIDLLALLPIDIITYLCYYNFPFLRLPRLLKITSFWELFARLDTSLSSPFIARISKTILYMLYMIHLNACAYYALSDWEGKGSTEWTYGYGHSADGNAYIRCFYFATKTATSIGKNPRPSNEVEYLFMTFAWLSGVFLFALLLGQIRDIIATATKTQTDYRQVCDATFNYLQRIGVPSQLHGRVKSWLNYTWAEQKTLDEAMIIAQLPHKMQADIALHVHIDTLSKVKLFQNCETAFLRDLVVKLRSIIYLPGDYVCRKGEVGKEMYIIRTGRVNVLGGENGQEIFATLSSGSVFGEIALLAIGGMTRRTADVRTAGFANLYVLNKADLNQAIKDYPQAQESLRKKAKKIIRENAKKRKALAEEEAIKKETEALSAGKTEFEDEKIIIQNKPPQPRLVDAVLKALRPGSMAAKYLKYGSKASSIEISDEGALPPSYPPSPYLRASPLNLSQHLTKTFDSDSSDEELKFVMPNHSVIPVLNIVGDDDDDVFLYDQSAAPQETYQNKGQNMAATPNLPIIKTNEQDGGETLEESTSSSDSRFQLQRQFSVDVGSNDSVESMFD